MLKDVSIEFYNKWSWKKKNTYIHNARDKNSYTSLKQAHSWMRQEDNQRMQHKFKAAKQHTDVIEKNRNVIWTIWI